MQKIHIKLWVLLPLLLGAFNGCEVSLEPPTPSANGMDFSKYIAYGSTITGGFADGALYADAQAYSYPNIIAQQLQTVGGGTFTQPLMPGNGIDSDFDLGRIKLNGLALPACALADPSPDLQSQDADPNALDNISAQGPFQNLGIPGVTVGNMVSPFFSGVNPYFLRMIPDGTSASYLDLVYESKPTFFTSWLGNQDVLSFAASGGTDPFGQISVYAEFEANYNNLLDSLTAMGAKGVVANIPDFRAIPYFTTVGIKAIDETACDGTMRDIYISTASGVRMAAEGDFILLPAAQILGTPDLTGVEAGFDPSYPLSDDVVLDIEEAQEVIDAVVYFNQVILAAANAHDEVVFLDMNEFLGEALVEGLIVDGVEMTNGFLTGGAFSLDGIHPTPRGQALIANKFIEKINEHYGSSIPTVNAVDYPAVEFP